KSDGTSAGTTLTQDSVPGWNSDERLTIGDRLFYLEGSTVYSSDGAAAGPVPLAQDTADARSTHLLTAVGGRCAFVTYALDAGSTPSNDVWISDGTPSGTVRLAHLPYPVTGMAEVNGTLFFAAS